MQLSPNKIRSLEHEWTRHAGGEEMKVEQIKGALYAFGSELGCLRLHYKMNTGRVGYSENLESWYYSLELKA